MKATTATKAYRWGQSFLLATEFIVVVLLVSGGCYSKQNYQVLAPQTGDTLLDRCNVVVEGRIAYVRQRTRNTWVQDLFFCWPIGEGPQGPDRFDVSIDIDTVLKGDSNMPRRLQVNNCRPLRNEESAVFSQAFFPTDLRVRIGYNHKLGKSLTHLTVVPLPTSPTTQPK